MKIVDFINFYNPNIINPYIILLPFWSTKRDPKREKFLESGYLAGKKFLDLDT